MTEPSRLEYCVRQVFHDPDEHRTAVVPSRPVNALLADIEAYASAAYRYGACDPNTSSDALNAARDRVRAQLGLGASDGGR